jgi:hypothetical protein
MTLNQKTSWALLFMAIVAAWLLCGCRTNQGPVRMGMVKASPNQPNQPPLPPGAEETPPIPEEAVAPPFYQLAVFFGCGPNIAADGNRHAFVFSTWTAVYAWIWTTETDGYAVQLPGWGGIGCTAVALDGNTLVVADGGMRITTFQLAGTTATVTDDFNFAGGGCPAMCRTAGGGIFVINYAHNTPNNLHVAYRSPAGAWTTNGFSAGPWDSVKPEYISCVSAPDGLVYVAINRDSSHSIDIARFNEGQLVDFHQALLNHTTPNHLAPNGEFPNVTMGTSGNKVLLAYQNHHQEWPCGDLYSYVAVAAIAPDMSFSLVALSTNIVNEVFTWSPVFGHASGFNLLTYELNRNTCENGPYRLRGFDGEWSVAGETWTGQNPNGIIWSQDGWGLWREAWPNNTPKLVRFPVVDTAPVLTIARQEGGVVIGWSNPQSGDTLEANNGSGWQTVGTANPVTMEAEGNWLFRVRRIK